MRILALTASISYLLIPAVNIYWVKAVDTIWFLVLLQPWSKLYVHLYKRRGCGMERRLRAEGEGSADGWCGERGGNLLPSGGRGDDVVSGPTWGCQAPSGARWPLPPGLTCSPVTRQQRRERGERRGKRRRALIRAETGAWWPDTLLNTAGIKTWGGFVRTQQRQWGREPVTSSPHHTLPPSETQ